jgi:hypothetical protein
VPRPNNPHHRSEANHLLAPLARPTYLLRMAPERVGRRAFLEWVSSFRDAALQAVERADELLQREEERDEPRST